MSQIDGPEVSRTDHTTHLSDIIIFSGMSSIWNRNSPPQSDPFRS